MQRTKKNAGIREGCMLWGGRESKRKFWLMSDHDFEVIARERLERSALIAQSLAADPELAGTIAAAARLIVKALANGHKLLLFGNGGSAADAQHLAAELMGRYRVERRALPAIALTVNTSSVTAIANDYAFERVFARQVEALGVAGDVALAISTSGESPNVLAGVDAAKRRGLATLGLTGKTGGRLRHLVDLAILAPTDDTPRVQEAHILIGHILCELAERELAQP